LYPFQPTDYGRNFDVALPSTENGEIKITFAQGSLCAKGYRRKRFVAAYFIFSAFFLTNGVAL
jgi:hypothetical protein